MSLSSQTGGSECGRICCCLTSGRLKSMGPFFRFNLCRLETQDISIPKWETENYILPIVSPRDMGVYLLDDPENHSRDDPETQSKECLLKGYIYPFPMKRLQFGTSQFQCCDWLLASGGAHIVKHTLLSPVELICIKHTVRKCLLSYTSAFLTFQTNTRIPLLMF